MGYYIFCDLKDAHIEKLEHDAIFEDMVYAHKLNGTNTPNVTKINIGDNFLFMGRGFKIRTKGRVRDKPQHDPKGDPESEYRPIYRFTFDIEQMKREICLDDLKWRKFLASVRYDGGKYGTFIKDENVKPLKAYFRNVVRRINKEIYEKIANAG